MKIISLVVLLPLTVFAGGKGARALEDVQDAVAYSDADCSKRLVKKLEALASDLDDGLSKKKLKAQVRELRDYADDKCPKKLAGKVNRALDKVMDSSSEDDDDDDDRSSRRRRNRDDDDDDDAPAPRKRVAVKDCGTGVDPGCGPDAMDAIAFRGLVSSLQANPNEYTKLDLVRNSVSAQRLTAAQLGPVLDQFQNEFLKLDAAKAAVPRLTDPQHALGHSAKFRNTFIASDYSKLLAR